jgi:uncharacterized protein (DUF488 family)
MKIWTVDHSTKGIGEFVELLVGYEIEALADVRRYPASRKHPHFYQERLHSFNQLLSTSNSPTPYSSHKQR